jgi:outer membrane receptor for ferrienterochelin and colicin
VSAALRLFCALGLALSLAIPGLSAQQADSTPAVLDPIVVTSTRSPRKLIDAPAAMSVLTRADLQRRPLGSPIDLFASLPGLDLTGVGPNQRRPVIRGISGQRILLLEDGLRVNNSRRQQDFGELPALINQQALDRVEVVRGPASVLYGSDAIGGVVNLITTPLLSVEQSGEVHGTIRYGYAGGVAATHRPSGSLHGRTGPIALRVDADFRDAANYTAPAGSFGDLTVAERREVPGSGVEDRNLRAHLGFDISTTQHVFVKHADYEARDAGFGYLDPELASANEAVVDIRYPLQQVRRTTAGWVATRLGLPIAERVQVTGFTSDNRRQLDQDIWVPFGPGTPPGAGVQIATRNFTDVDAIGARLEAQRAIGTNHAITWGVEFGRDRAEGTDSNATTVIGFGPPSTETSNRPALPRAEFRSLALFAQDELRLSDRFTLVLGGRYQDNTAESFVTAGLEEQQPVRTNDATGVWSASMLVRLAEPVRLVAAASRGFRSPNLVERFYDGVTPEGSAYQSRNLALQAESSTNVDLGVRVQQSKWNLEIFAFQNQLRDGIRSEATGAEVQGFPEYRNVNIDRLRIRGVEVAGSVSPISGFTLAASATAMDEQDIDRSLEPGGESLGSKVTGSLSYRLPSGRVWAGLRVRHQGEREGAAGESALVGEDIPAFTVVDLDVGALAFQIGSTAHLITATVENVGNTLYAEAGNTGFFRPAPARRLHLMWRTEF